MSFFDSMKKFNCSKHPLTRIHVTQQTKDTKNETEEIATR